LSGSSLRNDAGTRTHDGHHTPELVERVRASQ
jgi:hypothetical protein